MAAGFDSIMIVGFIFGMVILILWTLLPFAVFGIKDRLDKLLEAQEKTNEILMSIRNNRI